MPAFESPGIELASTVILTTGFTVMLEALAEALASSVVIMRGFTAGRIIAVLGLPTGASMAGVFGASRSILPKRMTSRILPRR